MKMKLLVGGLIFLIVINLATIGTFVYMRFAHHPPPGMPGFDGPPHGPLPLNGMDEGQRKKVMDLVESLRDETAELNDKAAQLERRTFELMQETPGPEDSIDQGLRDLSAVRLEISRRVTKKFMEAKSFLTPEQQRMMFHEMSRGHHGPPPGGPGREGPPFDRPPDH